MIDQKEILAHSIARIGGNGIPVRWDKESPSSRPVEFSSCICSPRGRSQPRRTIHRRSYPHQRGHRRLLDRIFWNKMYTATTHKPPYISTNFSYFVTDGDLDPHMSRYTLTPLKLVYKKLRLLVDRGCIFIGHGLSKDFRIISE